MSINNGQFNLIIGSMFSGKSTELIRRYNRYTIGGKKCLMIKYKNDTRYDSEMVVTHDNIKINAIVCEFLSEADKFVKSYDVVCVDEVQFYQDAYIFCDKWANDGKIVEACGLNGTFNRTPFEIISRLIPKSENITFLKAICKETGNDAVYSQLNTDTTGMNKDTSELIGGSDKYSASDRETYFKYHPSNSLQEYLDFYAKLNKYENINLMNFIDDYSEQDFKVIAEKALGKYLSG